MRRFALTIGTAALAMCAACTPTTTGDAASAGSNATATGSTGDTGASSSTGAGADTSSAVSSSSSSTQAGGGATTPSGSPDPMGGTAAGSTGAQTGTGTSTASGSTTQGGSAAQGSATGSISPVTQADVQTGTTVRDQSGQTVGTVESVDAQGAVISTGSARAKIPFSGLGRTSSGLVTSATRAQLEAAAGGQQQPQ